MSDQAQTPAILDDARALAQRDGRARPALAGGAESGECDLIVLHAGDVFHDALAVRRPAVDAEGEVSSGPSSPPYFALFAANISELFGPLEKPPLAALPFFLGC